MTQERCLKCDWWSFTDHRCSRVLKGRLLIAHGGGELTIETQPGLIPEYLQEELEAWLVDAITTAVDSYPGWAEINKLRETNGGCAGQKANKSIKQFGSHLSLAKPLVEPKPELNLDAHGLFKSDVSIW
jgi:hypothetical protein